MLFRDIPFGAIQNNVAPLLTADDEFTAVEWQRVYFFNLPFIGDQHAKLFGGCRGGFLFRFDQRGGGGLDFAGQPFGQLGGVDAGRDLGEERPQFFGHLQHGGRTAIEVGSHHLAHQQVELHGQGGHMGAGRGEITRAVKLDGIEEVADGIRPFACQRLIKHDPQRINIGPFIYLLSLALLGRHIGGCAKAQSLLGMGQRPIAHLYQPKICHHRPNGVGGLGTVLGDENVVGLEVAVEQPFLMSVGQHIRDLDKDVNDFFEGHPVGIFNDELAQAHPLDELHHNVIAVGNAAEVEHFDDIVVV